MKRPVILSSTLAVIMSAIFYLPESEQIESALEIEIPESLGSWRMATYPPSEKEIGSLAPDTQFAKAHCLLPRSEEMSQITFEAPIDRADLSIVLSGYDLANSIHRPERCMPAQGHKIVESQTESIRLDSGHELPVTRLLSKLTLPTPEGQPPVVVDALTYYFFVGMNRVTESHLERTLVDIKDRVLRGEAQQWAYVSISMPYIQNPDRRFGEPPNLEMAEEKARSLIADLAEENIRWDRIRP